MQKTILGIGVGGAGGFLSGFVIGCLLSTQPPPPGYQLGVFLGVLLAAAGAAIGAIAGGVADIIDFLKKTLPAPVNLGPEADYKEPTAPPPE